MDGSVNLAKKLKVLLLGGIGKVIAVAIFGAVLGDMLVYVQRLVGLRVSKVYLRQEYPGDKATTKPVAQ